MTYETERALADSANGLRNPTLSMNASTSVDYSPALNFIDLMKMMRPWSTTDGAGIKYSTSQLKDGGYLDADGWVTHLPEGSKGIDTHWAWSKFPLDELDMRGRYVIEYEGTGKITLGNDAKIISNDPGRIVFENVNGKDVFFKIVQTDPAGTGDYIRNISMVAEKNVALHEAGAVFNPDWLDKIKDLRDLRFMDWMGTNNSQVTSWDDLPSPDGPNMGGGKPIEYMVQLANQIGVDPWFNMPHMADADYIRKFATYVRDNLDPALKVRVEYSNEAWNWSFQQTGWLKDQAVAEWGVADPRGYYVKKATEMALNWDDVFKGENEDRLIKVLGIQTAGTGGTTKTLDPTNWAKYEPDAYIDPKTLFDEVAGTTYFGGGLLNNAEFRAKLLTAIQDPKQDANAFLYATLLDPSLSASVPGTLQTVATIADIVHNAGLKMTLYEGGQHLHALIKNLTSTPEEIAILEKFITEFVRGDEMAQLYRDIWTGWSKVGDGAFMQFADVAAPSKYGSWGLYSSLVDETPRSLALEELNATSTPWWDTKAGAQYQQGVTRMGTAQDDVMVGTSQEDFLIGDAGNDVFIAGRGNDGINGGAGTDRVIFNGVTEDYKVQVDGKGYRIVGPDGNDFLVNVEQISFDEEVIIDLASLARNADGLVKLPATVVKIPVNPVKPPVLVADGLTINGTNSNDVLNGRDGNDVIKGNSGHDTISGGSGQDSLFGGNGMDTLNGDNGNDVLLGDRGGDKLFGGLGNDILIGGEHNDYLTGGAGSDRFVFTKGDGHDRILDFTREDTVELRGFLGAGQTLESAATQIKGKLVISNGADSITFDGLQLSDLSSMLIEVDGKVVSPSTSTSTTPATPLVLGVSIEGTRANDTLKGGNGDDKIQGYSGHDTISGGKGADSLRGGNGMDTLNGDEGNDFLRGGNGTDKLFGGSGDDVLIGEEHNDYLTGGSGKDRFVFAKGDGADRVMDFTKDDVVEFRDFLGAGQTLKSSASEFKGNLVISNGVDKVTFEGLHVSDLSWMSIEM